MINSGGTREEVRALISAFAPEDVGPVSPEQRLVDDLGFDSLRLVELAIGLEEHFGLDEVHNTEISVETVHDVERLVENLLMRGRA